MTSKDFDAIVIGADAGGLMAAAYLARCGLSTLLTERAGRAGGHYSNTLKLGGHEVPEIAASACALYPNIIRELKLENSGCTFRPHLPPTRIMTGRHAPVHSLQTFWQALRKLWWQMCAPSNPQTRDMLQAMDATTLLKGTLASRAAQAGLAFDAMEGGMAPDDVGSAQALIWHAVEEQGVYPEGGFPALIETLTKTAEELGVTIRLDAEVSQITTMAGAVNGVRIEDGGEITCEAILSTLPRMKTQGLLPLGSPWFSGNGAPQEVGEIRLLFLLKKQPAFADSSLRILFAESLQSALDAHTSARAGKMPQKPLIEALCDPLPADAGRYVLSLRVRPLPVKPEESWAVFLPRLVMETLNILEDRAPGLKASIEDLNIAMPDTSGGVVDARRMSGSWRSRIAAPVPGLFFCGLTGEPVPVFTGRAPRIAARLARDYIRDKRLAKVAE